MDNTPNRRADDKRAAGQLQWGESVSAVVSAAQPSAALYGAIMNLPANVPESCKSHKLMMAYKIGHRDARHCAADLVVASEAVAGSAAAQEGPTLPKVESREFHELAMDYRGASFSGAHKAYQALVAHVEQLVAAAGSASPAAAEETPMHKDVEWLVEAAEMARANPEVATKIRMNCKAGYDLLAHAGVGAQPVLYARQWELDSEPLSSKHGIITSRTAEDDWIVPLYLAAPSSDDARNAAMFDFRAHLARQAAFSLKTFGPGMRTKGVCDHIRKELLEIEADPADLGEWVDVVILGLDGAWRCGGTPEQIIAGIVAKQAKNEGRTWPAWRTADPNKAIEHDRSADAPAAAQSVGDAIGGNHG